MVNNYNGNSVDKFEGKEPFTMLPNRLIADKRLDGNSFKVISYMLSRPDDWKFNTYEICNFLGIGRDMVRSRLNILEKLGYLIRSKTIMPNGTFGPVKYLVSHKSLIGNSVDKPVDNNAEDINTKQKIALERRASNQALILPLRSNPAPAEPGPDEPAPDNPSYTNIDNTNTEFTNIDYKKIGETLLLKPARAPATNIGSVGKLRNTFEAIDDDFKKSGDEDEIIARKLNNKLKDKISVADLRSHIERYGVGKVSETVLTLIEKGILNKSSPGAYLQSVLIRGGVTSQKSYHDPEICLKIDCNSINGSTNDCQDKKVKKYTYSWWNALDENQKTTVIEKCCVPFPILRKHIELSELDVTSTNFGVEKGKWLFDMITDVCESHFVKSKDENKILVSVIDDAIRKTNYDNCERLVDPFGRSAIDVLSDLIYIDDVYDG